MNMRELLASCNQLLLNTAHLMAGSMLLFEKMITNQINIEILRG
jgi:hypothetical protein